MVDRVHVGEVRAEGRTLSGTVLRYGELSPSHRERFEPGSLRLAGDVWLDLEHDPLRVVAWEGAGLTFAASADALSLRAVLPRIPAADLALEGVRDGTRSGLSIEFRAERERKEAQTGVRIIELARLAGVGLVARPSYPSSRVLETRQTGQGVSGSVGLGEDLSCQCREGCTSIRIDPAAFNGALLEAAKGEREIVAFLTGDFGRPVASTANGSLRLRVTDNQLVSEIANLPDTQPVRDFLEVLGTSAARFQTRPYFPDATSEFVKVGQTARFKRADLRGIEISPISGPNKGIQPLRLSALVDADLDDTYRGPVPHRGKADMALTVDRAARWLGGIITAAPGVAEDLEGLIAVSVAKVDRYAPERPKLSGIKRLSICWRATGISGERRTVRPDTGSTCSCPVGRAPSCRTGALRARPSRRRCLDALAMAEDRDPGERRQLLRCGCETPGSESDRRGCRRGFHGGRGGGFRGALPCAGGRKGTRGRPMPSRLLRASFSHSAAGT